LNIGFARAAHDPAAYRPADCNHAGVDHAQNAEDFVNELRSMDVRRHVAQNTSGRSFCE